MRRLSLILTLLAMSGLATGGLDFVHQQQHRQQMDQWLTAIRAAAIKQGRTPAETPAPSPNKSNCPFCQAIHSPLSSHFVQPLIFGLERTAQAIFSPPPVVFAERIALPIASRGPPVV